MSASFPKLGSTCSFCYP